MSRAHLGHPHGHIRLGQGLQRVLSPLHDRQRVRGKGTVFRQGKPATIFEACGITMTAMTEAARAKAQEIHRRLKGAKVEKRSTKKC